MANIIQTRGNSALNSPKEIMANAAERRRFEMQMQQRSDEAWMQNLMQQTEMYKDPRQKQEYLRQVLSSPEARERMARIGMTDPSQASVAPTAEMRAEDAIAEARIGAVKDGGYPGQLLVTDTKMGESGQQYYLGKDEFGPEVARQTFELGTGARQTAHQAATVGETRRNNVAVLEQNAPVAASRADYYSAGAGRNRQQAENLRQETDPNSGLVTSKIKVKQAGKNPGIEAAQQAFDAQHKTYLMLLDKSISSTDDDRRQAAQQELNEVAKVLKTYAKQLQALYAKAGAEVPAHVVNPKLRPAVVEDPEELEDDDPEGLF